MDWRRIQSHISQFHPFKDQAFFPVDEDFEDISQITPLAIKVFLFTRESDRNEDEFPLKQHEPLNLVKIEDKMKKQEGFMDKSFEEEEKLCHRTLWQLR